MTVRKLGAAIALFTASGVAAAQPYQAELRADLADANGTDVVALHAYGYFDTVQTQDHPLREAAFLEQISNVNLQYLYSDLGDSDSDNAQLNLEYYVPNSIFYLGAHYQYQSFDESSENDWGVTAGVTPFAGLLVTTTYWDEPGYDLNLRAKYVTELTGETAINVEAGYQDGGDAPDDTITLAADYYFNRAFSVGAWLQDQAETGFGVRTEMFFTPTFSARASYFDYDGNDTISIGASLRF